MINLIIVYIDWKGELHNTTLDHRREEYFVQFNFSCKIYQIENEGNNITLIKSILVFSSIY